MDNSELSRPWTAGFRRPELRHRYDISNFSEDAWHTISGDKTRQFVDKHLMATSSNAGTLLNAGAGSYRIHRREWQDVSLDIFLRPIQQFPKAVCGTVEMLPFADRTFDAIICVGEVLSYCDPLKAINEFARVSKVSSLLIIDFESTNSPRFWMTPTAKKTADVVVDEYNGTSEKVWVYNPKYIKTALKRSGFDSIDEISNHFWSALGKRAGLKSTTSAKLQRALGHMPQPNRWGDLRTIAALRSVGVK